MTREQIEKEAREYSDVIWNNDRARDISKIAFFIGAQWRINSVWHDVSEKPEANRHYLELYRFEDKVIAEVRLLQCPLRQGRKGLVAWAYVDDLLPERKERRE